MMLLKNQKKKLDKKIEKDNKKLFEVKNGKKVLIVNQKLHTFKDIINVYDETEMVIRLLQFGPVIKVLEPDYIVAEIVKRLSMQLRLIK